MTTPQSPWTQRAAARNLPASDRTGTVLRIRPAVEAAAGTAAEPHIITVACLQGTCPRHKPGVRA